MEPGDVFPIDDFSNETLLGLAERLETSVTFQQLIVRELELDEVWRRVDTLLKNRRLCAGGSEELQALERLHGLVFEAHDLAAAGHAREAAQCLRRAMAEAL